ncbi:MAG: hypothetical protein ACXVCY_04630 [Pseudobdellovibrionaceae bacterium]
MAVGKYHFSNIGLKKNACEQGSTFEKQFTWKVKNAANQLIPVDLQGYSARMQVRPNYKSPFVIELTTENSRIILGGQNGTIRLFISAEDTAAIPAKTFIYDLELVSPNGNVKRLIEGDFEVSPEVTK